MSDKLPVWFDAYISRLNRRRRDELREAVNKMTPDAFGQAVVLSLLEVDDSE